MKSIFTFFNLIICLAFPLLINAQVIQSSCEIATVPADLNKDAAYLTYKYIYQYDDQSKNDVELSEIYKEQFLDAIIAVRNVVGLEVIDTIFNQYNIKTFPYISLNEINVFVDSSTVWYHELKEGNIPTGYSPIDDLMEEYSLTVGNLHQYGNYHFITFELEEYSNVDQLSQLFDGLEGVLFSETISAIGDGNDITGRINEESVSLLFSRGWGDCPSGCINREYWEFTVYPDCSVQYHGRNEVFTSTDDILNFSHPTYPNPFTNEIYVEGDLSELDFKLMTIHGQIIKQGRLTNNVIDGLYQLPNQVYILKLEKGTTSTSKLFIKN